ncbi:trypsin-like peptidase domain-containing protein [Leptospira sp. 201903070]|uniref:Trypsin-like peptidase domain-containing protein n=1 Tax=Leptospira ainlahdjerensis TaxID=2810033 RepID=A0ABS2UE06_9LEPT|nr:serine protease [Leptospira ainlahdjerensis]MBM9578605.1 trypsin-like peptidase domain-containing protein [Leptospira ainlahdjerensis]
MQEHKKLSFLYVFLFLFITNCHTPKESAGKWEDKKNRSVLIYRDKNLAPLGTGCVFGKNQILTTEHILRDLYNEILVSYDGKNFFKVTLLKVEKKFDLASLQLQETSDIFPKDNLEFVDRSEIIEGLKVFAWTGAYGGTPGIYFGYISHVERRKFDPSFPEIPFIQVNQIAYPGASGSCVFLENGKAFGIVRSSIGITEGSQIGLVIPYGYLKVFLRDLY